MCVCMFTYSLATIVKISKNAVSTYTLVYSSIFSASVVDQGPVLKPHIPSLVTAILEMLSSVESQV